MYFNLYQPDCKCDKFLSLICYAFSQQNYLADNGKLGVTRGRKATDPLNKIIVYEDGRVTEEG